MKAIDVCAGAGGLSLGLRRAGFDVLGVENDPYAVETHRRHVGPCDEADVTTWHPPSKAFLVAGGVPCQPWSDAGHRKGFEDERGQLYRHLLRIAVEADARIVLFENVTGLVRRTHPSTGETALGILLEAFREHGFEPSHKVLDFAGYGLPQRRKRLIVVGRRDGETFSFPKPTHGEGLRHREKTVRDALSLVGGFKTGHMTAPNGQPRKGWQGVRYVDVDRPGHTVGTRGNADWIAPVDGRPWRLGVHELALLQDFPPTFTFSGDRHRLIGNAVPPTIGELLGRAISRISQP